MYAGLNVLRRKGQKTRNKRIKERKQRRERRGQNVRDEKEVEDGNGKGSDTNIWGDYERGERNGKEEGKWSKKGLKG